LFHFEEDHGGDFLGREFLLLAEVVDFNERCALAIINEREGPLFSVLDDLRVIESTTNKTSTRTTSVSDHAKGA
jgi:hypothetical protein